MIFSIPPAKNQKSFCFFFFRKRRLLSYVVTAEGFLTPDRARAWGLLFASGMLLILLVAYVKILTPALSDPMSRPVMSDFGAFWSGGRLALQAAPQLAYDGPKLRKEENQATQVPPGEMLPYQYPPNFQMLCLPFAALPYIPALLCFQLLFTTMAILCIRRLLPTGFPMLPILGFPGLVINFIIGQNGCFSTSLFGAAALWLDKRPVLAGAVLGGFACKPHLAVALPFALGAARRWRAFMSCGATASAITAASLLALGPAPWQAFFKTLWISRAVLQSAQTGPKVITVYEAVRLLHGGVSLALATQAVSAVLCLGAVAYLCRKRPGAEVEIALAALAGLLAIPYAMDYDLFILALPLAWVLRRASSTAWRPGEKWLLVACYALPLVARTVNLRLGLPLTPVLVAALFVCLASRARSTHASA
jgi:hypothetical protein